MYFPPNFNGLFSIRTMPLGLSACVSLVGDMTVSTTSMRWLVKNLALYFCVDSLASSELTG